MVNSNRQLIILALSIFIGVLIPSLAALCKPLLMPVIFLLFTFAILQVRFGDALSAVLRERSSWIILLWQLLCLPLLFSLFLYPWHQSQWYVFAIVTMCTGSITATTALARIFNLNEAMSLVVCLAGAVLMPIPLYFFLTTFTGVGVEINLNVYAWRIAVFIFTPFVLVALIRTLTSPSADQAISRNTPQMVLVLLMIFGLSVMDGVQALLISNPVLLLSLVILAFSISFSVQLLTFFFLRFLGVKDAKTACILCAYKNMGVVAAIAGDSLGEHFLIFVGIWQLPMYTLPLLLKKFYRA